MPITSPVTLPTAPVSRNLTLTRYAVTGSHQDPFALSQQFQVFDGQMWLGVVQLPAMRRAVAAPWVAALTSLNGQEHSFDIGPYHATTGLGDLTGSPLEVKGAGQTGQDLAMDGATINKTPWVQAGTYCQIGTSLYLVLTDANSDGFGNVTLTLWPDLRQAYADNTTVDFTSPVGRFRLIGQEFSWSINEAVLYGIAFAIKEDR